MNTEELDNAVLDLLQEFTGIQFSEVLRECLRRSLPGSGNNHATYGLTTTRILLSFLFFGKHRPGKDEELTRLSDLVGDERISNLDQRYRQESETFDNEVEDLANSNDNFTRKVQTLFAGARELVLPSQQELEPYHVLAVLLREREFDYDWLVRQWPNFRDEAAWAVFFYERANDIPKYELAHRDREQVLDQLPAEVLSARADYLPASDVEHRLNTLPETERREVLESLSDDELVDFLQEVDEEDRGQYIELLDEETRQISDPALLTERPSSESEIEATKEIFTTSQSNTKSDWEDHLQRRFNATFSPDGVALITAAAAQSQKIPDQRPSPSGILNTRDFLPPMLNDSQLLKSLQLGSSMTVHMGGYSPPWHEEMCDRDSNPDSELAPGSLPFSGHVEKALGDAAKLAASNQGYRPINKWHIALAIISSHAPGVTTALSEGGTDVGNAIEVLLANFRSYDPSLANVAGHMLRASSEGNPIHSIIEASHLGSESNQSLQPALPDLASLRKELTGANLDTFDRFGREHAPNLSLSCRGVLLISWEMAARLEEDHQFSSVSPALLYAAFLMTGIYEAKEPYSESSLSSSVVGGLSMNEGALLAGYSNYREVYRSTLVSNSGVRATNGFIAVWQEATSIRNSCSPGEVVAARHLLGAFIRLSRREPSISQELAIFGFPIAEIVKILHEHLKFYAATDRSKAWDVQLAELLEGHDTASDGLPGNEFQPKREANDHELCLNVDAYARAVAQLLRDADKENDFVLAIYGPWGRGKTTLMRKVKPLLAPSSSTAEAGSYAFVDFSAWKYPTRPEVWIHLYEQIAQRAVKVPTKPGTVETGPGNPRPSTKDQTDEASRKPEPFVDSFWQKSRLAFRMGLLRSGWTPLLTGLIFLFVTRLPLVEAVEWLRIGLGGFGALLLIGFAFSAFQFGRRLRMRYLSLPDHSENLGMQAVIGRDLANLLQVWLAPASANDPNPGQIDFRPGKPGFWGTFCVVLLIAATFVIAGLRIPRPESTQDGFSKPQAETTTSPSLRPQAAASATPEPTATAPQAATPATPATPATSPGAVNEATAPTEAAPAPSPAPSEILARDLLQQWVTANPSQNILQGPAPRIEPIPQPSPLAYWISVSVLSLAGTTLIFFFISLARPLVRHEKLLLTIDDLDRCEPDQMLAVIESLRLFLDNVQISRRLQVVMLVDQRFLGNALLKRARENGLMLAPQTPPSRRYVREQREKFFVAELGLPQISPESLSEMIDKHLGSEEREPSDPLSTPTVGTSPSPTSNKTPGAPLPEERLRATKMNEGSETESPRPSDQVTGSKPSFSEPKPSIAPESPQTSRSTPNPVSDPIGFSTKTIRSVRFSQAERDQLLKAIPELHQQEATPRQIRAAVVRYQLARMLLLHLGQPITEESVSKILQAIASQLNGTAATNAETVITQVAHAVVCPDMEYGLEPEEQTL